MLCEYGCGREAIHQFKNGKWCCSTSRNSCVGMKKKNSDSGIGKKHTKRTIKKNPGMCEYGCGQEARYYFKIVNNWCCSKNISGCPEISKKRSITLKGIKPKKSIKYSGLEICSYGCGQLAKYKMNNGKFCCSTSTNGCPIFKEKNRLGHIKNNKEQYNDGLCSYGCGQEVKYQFKNGKGCCSKIYQQCMGFRKKIKILNTGEKNPNFNKKQSKETIEKKRIALTGGKRTKESKKKMSNSSKLDIEQYQKRYPTFAKEEEMRYDPDKPIEEKEIQTHCKNSNCGNSKEKDGWFTPTRSQIHERIRAIETDRGSDGSYLYCSQHCKDTCMLYRSAGDDPYRSKVWNNQILKQDNYECQICGSKENLHCHHIEPVKLQPELALDPSNGIVLCQTCHIKYGHKKGTECSYGNLAKIVCKKKGKLYVKKTTTIKELSE